MAINNLKNYNLEKDGTGFSLNFRRGNPNPLDNSAVWATYAEAKSYAETDPTAYVGQVISVIGDDDTSVTIYSIQNEAGLLKEVGTVPVGDGNSITVADGKIKILGVDEAAAGASLVKGSDGKVKWVKHDNKSIEIDDDDNVFQIKGFKYAVDGQHLVKKGTDAVWETPDVYTKAEVDGEINKKLSNVYKYKGSVDTYSALPTENNVVGDVWNITKADKANGIKAGDNVAWTKEDGKAGEWDVLAGTVDLGDYSTTEAVGTLIDEKINTNNDGIALLISDKVSKEDGKGLSTNDFTNNDKAKLESVEANAQVNIINGIDTDQFEISKNIEKVLSIKAVESSKVTGLNTALAGKVDKEEGKGLSTNDLTNELKAKYDAAEANVIKKIMLGETEAAPDESKVVTIPAATAAALGLVKSSDAENTIAVAADGIMSVNSVNVNKLVQTAGDTLIIDGGALE